MKTDTPRPIHLKDYTPPSHLIDSVDLDVALHPEKSVVRSRLKVRPNPAHKTPPKSLHLDGEHLALTSIRLNGEDVPRGKLKVCDAGLDISATPLQPFTLDITTEINPKENKALQGLYLSRGVYCTQCEAEGFRRITYFVDRPDVLSTYTCRIEADRKEAPILLANGNLAEHGVLSGGKRHFVIWKDPHPKPCYLFALVGGDLGCLGSSFKTMSGRQVELRIYVEHGKEARARWAMDALKRSMRWDERRFGREYDLDIFNIVAVSDFNMGAMENKGLTIFNDRLILASPETATDANFESIESVVAHEYFHNWTGNRITCRDWFQLCLKEGLTVYRDQEFSGDERDPTVQRIMDVRQLKSLQFPEDSGPLAHPVRPETYIEINNFYTATVYEKGAELVRMIETILGREGFRKGMDLYFQRHDGQAATIEDFVKCFEDASGQDLSHFKLWYSQAGTPELVCELTHDARTKTAKLTIEQVLPATPGDAKKKPLHIPLRLGLLGANGNELELTLENGAKLADKVLHIQKRKESFVFKGVPSRPVPSLLRGFSAPVNLSIDLSDADLEFLMAHDTDLFNRWQATNTYAIRSMKQIYSALAGGKRTQRGAGFAKALGTAAADPSLKAAYKAELLKLPNQSDLFREIARNVDPEVVHRAHTQFLRLVGDTLGAQLEEIYATSTTNRPFSPDARNAGLRALRNAALTLLTARGSPEDGGRLTAHFEQATNMTDEAHALVLLAAQDAAEGARAIKRFHDRWKDDHLVIDTWFAAQAMSPLASTLQTVMTLSAHPLFKITTPNKVRALIGAFSLNNPLQFNRADGAGYDFVVQKIMEIDAFNPQVAARLLGSFRSYRALEPKRRAKARKALQRVVKMKDLSRDTYEIVSRMLEA
jgi:aminopeptidase N